MNEQAFKELMDQYITGDLDQENRAKFALLLEKQEYQLLLEAELERSFMSDEFDGPEPAARRDRLNKLIADAIHAQPQPVTVHRVHFLRRSWVRIAVAAAVVLLLGSLAFYAMLRPETKQVTKPGEAAVADVAPGGNKAKLILSDGRVIDLNSAANGILAQQGAAKIEKSDNGALIYKQDDEKKVRTLANDHSPVVYNTLATPRGGQYQLVLPDGSKVWLNAASSIRYPAVFAGNERRVEITGEAYFEVAHKYMPSAAPGKHSAAGEKRMPFVVVANGTEVTVLGTHFNVNTYAYESAQRITLLEGSVKVTRQRTAGKRQKGEINDEIILKPGEQSVVHCQLPVTNCQLTIDHSPDVDEVMAWKNGKFSFGEKSDIHSVMNQVADWYDVEVVYKGNIEKHIGGTISRDVNLSLLLQMLKTTGVVDFKINGKKLEVIPVN